ncbi:hypothetical protein GDO81_026845 [Engystomops pustulosus]|uniref:Uncharacterized protein n=1 Tax=Engystomops pustulosus TaxID=76066 RepID=A0AAV6YKQ3_ENGPU|nr:hypothetical protein GDO81_026845 [Engystomops pustulosus]
MHRQVPASRQARPQNVIFGRIKCNHIKRCKLKSGRRAMAGGTQRYCVLITAVLLQTNNPTVSPNLVTGKDCELRH